MGILDTITDAAGKASNTANDAKGAYDTVSGLWEGDQEQPTAYKITEGIPTWQYAAGGVIALAALYFITKK